MNKMQYIGKNISFDFDNTLDRPEIQAIAKKLAVKNTLWIITRRFPDEWLEVWKVAEKLGVPLTKIVFTAGRWKYLKIRTMNIDIHFDDKEDECNMINKWTKTKTIKV